jgi:hypothetical protein
MSIEDDGSAVPVNVGVPPTIPDTGTESTVGVLVAPERNTAPAVRARREPTIDGRRYLGIV